METEIKGHANFFKNLIKSLLVKLNLSESIRAQPSGNGYVSRSLFQPMIRTERRLSSAKKPRMRSIAAYPPASGCSSESPMSVRAEVEDLPCLFFAVFAVGNPSL